MHVIYEEWSLGISCPERAVKVLWETCFTHLPFPFQSLASPSCPTAWACGCRSHPITLLLGFISDGLRTNMRAKVSQKVRVVWLMSSYCSGTPTTLQPCSAQEKLFFSGKMRHVVKPFPFFLSFFPCCHSGFLTAARREAVGVTKRGMLFIKVWYAHALLDFKQDI